MTNTSSVLRGPIVSGLLLLAAGIPCSFGAISTLGTVSEETNTYYDLFGSSSTARINVPSPQGTFTQDFSTLGEEVWTVSWQAPAGQFIEIAPPSGWDSGNLLVEFQAGLSGGVSHYDTAPTLTLIGESGDSLGTYTTGSYMMVRPTSANTVNARAWFDLTPGSNYRVTGISLSTTVPAGINENINAAINTFHIWGSLSSGASGLTDPGQWVSLQGIPEPSGALLSLVGIAAIGLRRRRN